MTKAYHYIYSQFKLVGSMLEPPRWSRYYGRNFLGYSRDRALVPLDTTAKVLTFAAVITAWIACFCNWGLLQETRATLSESKWGAALLIGGQLFLLLNLAYFIWQLALMRKYRPTPAVRDDELPSCTVVVPAYNEGRQVLMTLRSLAASDFPPSKLQLIAVDDGSKDDTWEWMCQAERELGGRVAVVQLPRNKGKRHALYEGFRTATGDVLVTVDSDSIVEPQTLRRLLSPMARDRKVGAVAGNVRVLNLHEGIIPRMLDVSFVFSFDYVRAAQSMLRTVFCTPGALSAYRRDLVMNVVDEWRSQIFFGKPSNIGEDRAMTNLIIRQGFDVVFQQDAVVYTNVPTHYRTLCKMFIRWARSNVRENIYMNDFMFTRIPKDQLWAGRVILLYQWLLTLGGPFFFIGTLACLYWRPSVFMINILGAISIWSTVPLLFYGLRYRTTEAFWAYTYGVFNFMALSWIGPYSLFTVHRSGWLTRQKVSPVPSKPLRPALVPVSNDSDRDRDRERFAA